MSPWMPRATIVAILLVIPAIAVPAEPDPGRVLARVNGEPITGADLQFMLLSRGIPEDRREDADVRRRLLERLIDRQLMRAYLKDRHAKPDSTELESRLARIRKTILETGNDPQATLAQLGLTEEKLRREVALPLAWRTYFFRVVTEKRLREFFEEHREQFDGTKVRARQIFLDVDTGNTARVQAAIEKLGQIRADIAAGSPTFAEAARRHSEAPTAADGGDVGFFAYHGDMPEEFSRVAFSLQDGEISDPFVTPFGVHLVQVTDRKPGNLSLEDARPKVVGRLSEKLWNETVRDQRAQADIERLVDTQ